MKLGSQMFSSNALGLRSRISAETQDIPTEVFRGLPQSVQANDRILSQLGHGRFLQNPLQFIIHLSSYDSTLYIHQYLKSRKINPSPQKTVTAVM
jgi:hypothetical protein